MKKMNVVITSALMLACGFAAGWWTKARQSRHELADRTYYAFKQIGFSSADSLYDPDLWRRELGEDLTRALAAPWSQVTPDNAWGAAYWTMRGNDPITLLHTDGMTPSQEDEKIRYLCFLIERHAGAGIVGEPRREFGSLLTYPQEALDRNQDKIKRAVLTEMSSYLHGDRVVASCFAVHLTGSDWGRELCSLCLQQAAFPMDGDPFVFMMDGLGNHAMGKLGGLSDSVLSIRTLPTVEVQSGASWVLNRFMEEGFAKTLGTNNERGANFDHWKNELKTVASRPVAQQTQ
jgi:hypothetical protein